MLNSNRFEQENSAGVRSSIRAVKIDISPGELIDKITILAIKAERIHEDVKRRNVLLELDLLLEAQTSCVPDSAQLDHLSKQLKTVNECLWEIEDRLRECEKRGDFSDRFIELARAVYINNDRRAEIKRRINTLLSSAIKEEKSYSSYI